MSGGKHLLGRPKRHIFGTDKVGEKGQIVIPKQARDIFGIKPGDTLLLLGDEARGIAIPPKGAFAELFQAAFAEQGLHKTKSKPREKIYHMRLHKA